MKRCIFYFAILLSLLAVSCSGRDGIDGRDGFDGDEFEAPAFEIEVDLVLDEEINTYIFGEDINLLPADVLLVYRLEAVDNGLDIWRQLPQPFFTDEGTLYYNFDFTQDDYRILLEPDFDAGLVPADLVQSQVFRIVIIPASFDTSKLDKSNIFDVLAYLGIDEKDILKVK